MVKILHRNKSTEEVKIKELKNNHDEKIKAEAYSKVREFLKKNTLHFTKEEFDMVEYSRRFK